jgi:peptide/nickel transport system permease protein
MLEADNWPQAIDGLAADVHVPQAETASARPRRRRRRVARRWSAWLSAAWLLLLLGFATVGPPLGLPSPTSPDYNHVAAGPSVLHWLGTDQLGRDELARLAAGARVSLAVGISAGLIGMIVGVALGMLSGLFRGWIDRFLTGIADVVLSFPALVLLMTLVAIRGPSLGIIIVGLGITFVPMYMRLSRALTMSELTRDYVLASRIVGVSNGRLLFRQVLPNISSGVLGYGFVIAAIAMVAEGSLDFLGFGVQPPTPSWGGMIADGQVSLQTDPYLVVVPSITLLLTVMSLNILGEALRNRKTALRVTVAV